MRHSAAHVMAQAVMRLFEGVQLAFGPTTGTGFYYDFRLGAAALRRRLSARSKPRCRRSSRPTSSSSGSTCRATKRSSLCRELEQEFKVEHIETGLADEKTLSFYRQGEFVDLCRGKHIPSTGHIGKRSSCSPSPARIGKATPTREQLQRLYATAFFDKKELDAHLEQLEEAKRRDHRVLGKQLELFTISQTVGSGLILWLPKGAIIRQTLEDYIKSELRKRGYEAVYTPNIGRVELYQISGHFPYYSDSQFPPIEFDDGERYLLKPMNCPHHIMIYKAKPRSYRDLPVRLAEFGTVYRFEQSGELSGMTRVRGFTQDDAHIFCTEEQVADEFRGCLEMTQTVLASLGMNDYRVRLGFRDPKSDKYVGGSRSLGPGRGGAQSGLRVDELARHVDRAGRSGVLRAEGRLRRHRLHRPRMAARHRAARLQPAEQGAFGLEYIGADNQPHQPVMIHRAPLGSLERFVGVLIEHFAGAFPLWLAPEQVRVLTVSEKSEAYGREVEAKLKAAGLRVTGDYRGIKLNAKIREAQVELIPYMFVVGEKDRDAGTVAIRDRLEGDLKEPFQLDAAIAKLRAEIDAKTVRQVAARQPVVVADRTSQNEY